MFLMKRVVTTVWKNINQFTVSIETFIGCRSVEDMGIGFKLPHFFGLRCVESERGTTKTKPSGGYLPHATSEVSGKSWGTFQKLCHCNN